MKRFLTGLVLLAATWSPVQAEHAFTIARLHYDGGGDWYSDSTSLPNLLEQLRERLALSTPAEEAIVKPDSPDLVLHPMLYMTGHGTIRFDDEDIRMLRLYFERGGFLWADDNYGMDESFREQIATVFPDHPLVELPHDHPVFRAYYHFDEGLPKIHEHDGKRPQLFGIYYQGRLVVLYSYESDIGDGLESENVHPEDSVEIREQAMQMAINIALFALSN